MRNRLDYRIALLAGLAVVGATAFVAADTPAGADSTEREQPELVKPPGKHMKRPYLQAVDKRRWFKFGGNYWRLWGGVYTGAQPKGVSVTPDGKHIFVTNFGQRHKKNVYRYDPVTLAHTGRADFQGNAIESIISADSKSLYVTNFRYKEVVKLDTETVKVTQRYTVGRVPKHFALTPDESELFVANWDDRTVSVVDLTSNQEVAKIKVGKWPRGTVVTHDGRKAYVANFGSHTISVIDVAKREVLKTIKRCRYARHMAITDDDKTLIVSCYGSWQVAIIDTERDKIVKRVQVGNGPKTVEISRDQRFAYTADYRGNSMSIIDLNTWKSVTVPVPTVKTSGLTVSPDDRRVYITGWDSNNLLVFERLRPGDTPTQLGPKHPPKKCLRLDQEGCTKFP